MSYETEKDWTTEAGYRAVVIMGSMGHRCGYVGVSKDHPLFGVEYSAETTALKSPDDEAIGDRGLIPLICAQGKLNRPDCAFDVHGGITFSGRGKDGKYPVESDLWWFGFDCGHHGDSPSPEYIAKQSDSLRHLYEGDGTHRSREYVALHCERLAEQLTSRVNFPDEAAIAGSDLPSLAAGRTGVIKPTEHAIQCAFHDWMQRQYPRVVSFALDNAGKRSPAAAAWMRKQGMVPGVPDYLIAYARHGAPSSVHASARVTQHGLFLEFKSAKGKTTPAQDAMHARLRSAGYMVSVVHSLDAAMDVARTYLGGIAVSEV